MQFDGKQVVITGGASGIGAACARNFAQRGARVAIVDVNETQAGKVAAECGGIAVSCDVACEEAVIAMVADVERRSGEIDIFFHNAGIAPGGDPLSTDPQVWQRHWDVNLMAHVYATRAVLPGMLARGSGYMIHTASMAGILSSQNNAPYAVSKHAVMGFAEWMSFTYHDQGVRTSCLAPLGVRTPMLPEFQIPGAEKNLGNICEPQDVAEMVAQAVEQERFLILTDPLSQKWMDFKHSDLERWLQGMRRAQTELQ